jgi:prepilin-type N-terminal cleavage/methylation domain-containing protein/prepilin-type processing-associated H-X9-DG protein
MNQKHVVGNLKSIAGFTLIELLVVVAIIAVLISMLLPALSSAREQAKRAVCASSQRQLVVALKAYSIENNGWFPGGWYGTPCFIRDGNAFASFVGGKTGMGKLMACPSAMNNQQLNIYGYGGEVNKLAKSELNWDVSVPEDWLYMSYIYVGGNGTWNPDEAKATVGWWNGWPGTGSPTIRKVYTDPNELGPVPREELRARPSETGLVTDRMWLAGGPHDPGRYCDYAGLIFANHVDGKTGLARGGNITFIDGHAEWRSISPKVKVRAWAYGEYGPYVCY